MFRTCDGAHVFANNIHSAPYVWIAPQGPSL